MRLSRAIHDFIWEPLATIVFFVVWFPTLLLLHWIADVTRINSDPLREATAAGLIETLLAGVIACVALLVLERVLFEPSSATYSRSTKMIMVVGGLAIVGATILACQELKGSNNSYPSMPRPRVTPQMQRDIEAAQKYIDEHRNMPSTREAR